jgi:hypothetical protein
MEGSDEIIFSGAYKDLRLGMRFDVSGKAPGDVISALAQISSAVEPHAYRLAGIDMGMIEAMAQPKGSGMQGVCGFLQDARPRELQAALAKAVPLEGLVPAAESYMLNRLLAKAGVSFMPQPAGAIKPSREEPGDHLAFIAKYGNWVAIKKLGLEKVKDYEVSAMLAGVNHSVVNKAFDFAGAKDDKSVQEVLAGKSRKSCTNLCAALEVLAPRLTGAAGDAYVITKVMEGVGYKPYASPEMLTGAYPDIKPPKVKGRKPKA